mmetsp:Transcript_61150/g.138193  ORF Transcript_61150/g.138193 Transcript_61150/m.138193 type:complete len:467 (+) Transcript_61150:79-1479(+)
MGESLPFARYASEFVGTFVLVFTIGCNVLAQSGTFAGVSIGCALMVMIYSLGKCSGAHFNPAVTFSLYCLQKIALLEGMIYVVMQLSGAIAAGFCYTVMFGKSVNLAPTEGHTWFAAAVSELLYTFMLCFVVLNTAASKVHADKNQFYGLAIGFVIIAGAYSAGALSMGAFNPAVAIAIDVSSASTTGIKYCFLYTIVELLGAALAACLFVLCRPEELPAYIHRTELPSGPPHLPSKLTSEFIGTYILVLTVGLNVLNGSSAAAFSVAASLTCMIFALGSVSGAHFNPAVTTAIFCAGHTDLTILEVGAYILTQVIAGIMAAFSYCAIMGGKSFELYSGEYSLAQACTAELAFTFVLAFVVLSVATVKSPLSEFFGLAIGMCVTVGGIAVGAVSGASLNPAVSIGVYTSAAVLGTSAFWQCIAYSVAEIFAGAAAACVFQATQPSELKTSPFSLMGMTADYGATRP